MKSKLNKPLLSIAILTFNRSDYLSDLLESINLINPEMRYKIEVIVLNNGSTDNTAEIINLHKVRLNIKEISNLTKGYSFPSSQVAVSLEAALDLQRKVYSLVMSLKTTNL